MVVATDEQIEEAFIIFSADLGHGLPTETIGTVLRALGFHPSEPEAMVRLDLALSDDGVVAAAHPAALPFNGQEYVTKYDPQDRGFITLAALKKLVAEHSTRPQVHTPSASVSRRR